MANVVKKHSISSELAQKMVNAAVAKARNLGVAENVAILDDGVAQVDPFAPANQGDGRQLCRQMAAMTGAKVMAPVRAQEYHRSIKPWRWREIDFGDFEGPVYLFRSDGTVTNGTPWVGEY